MHDLDNAGLGAVLKTALDAVIVMRLDGVIAGWNDVAEQSFGWSYAEAHGQRMSDLVIPHRHREAHERGLAHYLDTGEGPVLDRRIEIEALNRDGREIPIELSITRTEQFGEPVFLGFLRDISERRVAAQRQELLIAELNHRVKNVLGVVSGIAHLTARNSDNVEDFLKGLDGRLAALGRAHEVLTAAIWERAPLHQMLAEMLGPYMTGDTAQIAIDGPDVLLTPQHLVSLSMILHELTTNAIKYGALSRAHGKISVGWVVEGNGIRLHWTEVGVEGTSPPTRQGFGSRMIARSIAHELRGQHAIEWRPDGMDFRLTFPIAQDTGACV